MFEMIDRINHRTQELRDVATRIRRERELRDPPPAEFAAVARSATDTQIRATPAPGTDVPCPERPAPSATRTRAA